MSNPRPRLRGCGCSVVGRADEAGLRSGLRLIRLAHGLRFLAIIVASSIAVDSAAAEFEAFGPQNFVVDEGGSTVVIQNFESFVPDADHTLVVYNGGASGEFQPVTAASVFLNEELIVGPAEFAGYPSITEVSVSLDAINHLKVILGGRPDSGLAIVIRGDDSGAHPVQLEVLAPTAPSQELPVVYNSGWPLTLRLSFSQDPGLAVLGDTGAQDTSRTGPFPRIDEWGFVVWEDPDGCLSWADYSVGEPSVCRDLQTAGSLPKDETVLQFRPAVHPAPQLGAAPDMPALMLLADTGLGWNGDGPAVEAANLAGFVNVVALELNDQTRRTSLTTTLLVPFGLFAPRVDQDLCVGDPNLCEGSYLHRVIAAGQPTFSIAPEEYCDRFYYPSSIYEAVPVTLRAFVVKLPPPADPSETVTGPDTLEDMDGNGLVDRFDAELAGLELLSDEIVLQFHQLYGSPGAGAGFDSFFFPADLDGNGAVFGPLVEPCNDVATPIRVKKPPR